jgi:hypothetical protein
MKKEELRLGGIYQSVLINKNILIVRISQTGKTINSIIGKYYNEIKGEFTTFNVEDFELQNIQTQNNF